MFDREIELVRIGKTMINAVVHLSKIRIHIMTHKLDMACAVCKRFIDISQAISETIDKLDELE